MYRIRQGNKQELVSLEMLPRCRDRCRECPALTNDLFCTLISEHFNFKNKTFRFTLPYCYVLLNEDLITPDPIF